jgi:hypothetical protein
MAGSVYSNVTGTGLEVLFNVTEKASSINTIVMETFSGI